LIREAQSPFKYRAFIGDIFQHRWLPVPQRSVKYSQGRHGIVGAAILAATYERKA